MDIDRGKIMLVTPCWVGARKSTGKNDGFPFLDILGYLKNTHRNPKFGRVRHFSPNQGTWLGIPWSGLVSLCQMWDFYGYSLNTLKYPKMGIHYFFLWSYSHINLLLLVIPLQGV